MIQNKINNLVSIAIFLLCNKMLSGHKKVKIVLEMKFQDKTKSKRCIKMTVERHYCYEGHLFWKMFNVMWAISKRHASVALPIPDFSCILHFVVVLYLMFIYYRKRLSS